mgnify:CR=1 FL=1
MNTLTPRPAPYSVRVAADPSDHSRAAASPITRASGARRRAGALAPDVPKAVKLRDET